MQHHTGHMYKKVNFGKRITMAAIVIVLFSFIQMHSIASEQTATVTQTHGSRNMATFPLLEGMGDFHYTVTTDSSDAQKYMDQGMMWLQAFNHDAAIRSFKEATRLDAACAMAWWGIAYAEGPNYNDPVLNAARNLRACDALRSALSRVNNATALERDLIMALTARYDRDNSKDRAILNKAYADKMSVVWDRHPDDAFIGMLYAESRMTVNPWALYNNITREPAKGTAETEAVLEKVLALDPMLAGANHLYIHAVEMSASPERGLAAAERLCSLNYYGGHLNHMPAHIFTRTKMWDRSIKQNAMAMVRDAEFRESSLPVADIQYLYMTHNNHILAFSAMMVGREKEAMQASRAMWDMVPKDRLDEVAPWIDHQVCGVYDIQKRFGRWNALLEEPQPPACLPYTSALWRAHRAIAYANLDEFEKAEKELELYRDVVATYPADKLQPWDDIKAARRRLSVIEYFVPAEIALRKGQYEQAIELLIKAIEQEDKLGFGGEPPDYLQPVRHTLGAVYMKVGRYADAEAAYRFDLAEFPGNGWSLGGLRDALLAQGKEVDEDIESEFHNVWAKADEPYPGVSCLCMKNLENFDS